MEVEGSHYPSAPTEQVAYYLYRQANILPSLIDVNGYQIVYIGKNAVETTNEITLSGVPDREMGQDEQEFFSKALQQFLSSQVSADPTDEDALKIVSVTVNGQVIDTSSTVARVGGQRRLEASTTINVQVKGQYKPPPVIDFGAIVEDSINADPGRMERELKSPSPDLQGTIGESSIPNDYFQQADVIGSKEIKTPSAVVIKDTRNPMKGTLNMMAGVVGAMILVLSAAFFLRPHRRAVIFGSKSNRDAQLHTQLVHQDLFYDEKQGYSDQYGEQFHDNAYQDNAY